MKFANILVPFDNSEHAQSALRIALDLVGDEASAELHVITVLPTATLAATYDASGNPLARSALRFANYDVYENVMGSILSNAKEELLDSIGDALDEVSCSVTVEAVVSASPADGITEYAEDHTCDLIVMGRRGLRALRGMLGSVSYAVLRNADMPVLTVK